MGFLKKSVNDDFSPDGLSGGNSYQTNELLKAQHEINVATMPDIKISKSALSFSNKKVSKSINDVFVKENYDMWRLLNFQADYYCNVFEVKSDIPSLNVAIQLAKRTAFVFGVSVIYKQGALLIPCYIVNSRLNADASYEWIEITPAVNVMSQHAMTPKNDDLTASPELKAAIKNSWKLRIEGLDLLNCAILKWDTLSLGAWWKFLPFMQQQKRMLQMLNVESYSLLKKFSYKIANPNAIDDEVKTYFDAETPWVYTLSLNGELNNKISINELPNANTQKFTEFYHEWLHIWYNILGRRYNADFKKERNVSNEIEATQSNFDILENDHRIHLENFAKQLYTLTGFNIYFEGAHVI